MDFSGGSRGEWKRRKKKGKKKEEKAAGTYKAVKSRGIKAFNVSRPMRIPCVRNGQRHVERGLAIKWNVIIPPALGRLRDGQTTLRDRCLRRNLPNFSRCRGRAPRARCISPGDMHKTHKSRYGKKGFPWLGKHFPRNREGENISREESEERPREITAGGYFARDLEKTLETEWDFWNFCKLCSLSSFGNRFGNFADELGLNDVFLKWNFRKFWKHLEGFWKIVAFEEISEI